MYQQSPREDGTNLNRDGLNICPSFKGLLHGKVCKSCEQDITLDLSDININDIDPGTVICGDLANIGWAVVRSVPIAIEVSDMILSIANSGEWEGMEPHSMRRQKFNFYSKGTAFKKWNRDVGIRCYLSEVKTVVIDPNLPKGHNYDVGKKNLLTNLGPIDTDQWPHYDYSNPNDKRNVNTYTLQSIVVRDRLDDILFLWCKLLMHELVTHPIDTPRGINIVAEKPYGKLMINAERPATHRQYFGKDGKRGRVTYGIGSGSNSTGSKALNFVTKPFNYYLHRISKYLHYTLYYRRSEFNLETSNLSETFNHCTLLLYYAHPTFKKEAKMGYHTDVTYNHKGIYLAKLNGQKENTPTVIVNIGDSRKLKWRRRMLTLDLVTKRYKWVVDKKWKDVMVISSGTIVIINPLDEIPAVDPVLGIMIQYQHGGVVVNGSKFSCAYAFRNVKSYGMYNEKNELIRNTESVSNEAKALKVDFNHLKFHNNLKKLYQCRFRDQYTTFINHGLNV